MVQPLAAAAGTAAANDGPAVSPATNPPYPENPVNGAPTARRLDRLVDFLPFRSGPQGDPNTGQFPVVPAPIPVSDAAPASPCGPSARSTAAVRPSS